MDENQKRDFQSSFERYNQSGSFGSTNPKQPIQNFTPQRHDYAAEFEQKYANQDEPVVSVMDAPPPESGAKTYSTAGAGLSITAFALGVGAFFMVPAAFMVASGLAVFLKLLTFFAILASIIVGIIALVTKSRYMGLAITGIIVSVLSFIIMALMLVLQLLGMIGWGIFHTTQKIIFQ